MSNSLLVIYHFRENILQQPKIPVPKKWIIYVTEILCWIETNSVLSNRNTGTWLTTWYHVDKPECKKCIKALQELENIDDEADQLGIGFVKIADEALADEYNLQQLPALVYYRHKIPIIYTSKLQLLCMIYYLLKV